MSKPNVIYHNLSLTNNMTQPIPAAITDRREGPILDDPGKWEMSIVRFQISGDLIPLFHPIIPNPAFPLQTNMSVTLFYSGSYFQTIVSVTQEQLNDGVFYYGPYLDNINIALATSFTALKVAFPGAPQTSPPFLALNPFTQLISLYVQDSYLQSNINAIGVGFNQYLQDILDFPYSAFNGYSTPNGYDFVVDIDNHAILLPPAPRTGVPYGVSAVTGNLLQVTQEFPTLHLWDNIKSIIFNTSLIPITRESLPNTYSTDQNNNINSNTQTILTDFEVVKDISEPRPAIFQYIPPGEYRIISMNQSNAYSISDVSAQYQDYNGNYYPIYLRSGTNMSLKMMYRHKPDYYK